MPPRPNWIPVSRALRGAPDEKDDGISKCHHVRRIFEGGSRRKRWRHIQVSSRPSNLRPPPLTRTRTQKYSTRHQIEHWHRPESCQWGSFPVTGIPSNKYYGPPYRRLSVICSGPATWKTYGYRQGVLSGTPNVSRHVNPSTSGPPGYAWHHVDLVSEETSTRQENITRKSEPESISQKVRSCGFHQDQIKNAAPPPRFSFFVILGCLSPRNCNYYNAYS